MGNDHELRFESLESWSGLTRRGEAREVEAIDEINGVDEALASGGDEEEEDGPIMGFKRSGA
jgi:hypothetical protein